MSHIRKEGSYPAMLQGVSQQVEHERLAGQVQEQVNMMADPQTGLRRRPGAKRYFDSVHGGNALTHLAATEATIGGESLHVHVNAAAGTIKLYNAVGAALATLSSPYVLAPGRSNIRFANLNDELFILNTSKAPLVNTSSVVGNGAKGFFYVEAGAFNKKYRVEVKIDIAVFVAEHTTPDGTGALDAANCAPAAVATALRAALTTAGIALLATTYVVGQYVFIQALSTAATITVSADDSTLYVVTSAQSRVRQSSQLPARLPPEADGYVVAVGDVRYPIYYTYEASTSSWLESGKAQDISGISNVPISVLWNGSAYVVASDQFEGRTAGDEETNPQHSFMKDARITGMSAYQGRLVLLSGNMVSMSATNKPRRFFRTTVTSVLDSDPIEIGSGNITSANFTYAVAFNKDLVLFADRVQAVVPSQNTAITPRTAAVVLTGSFNTDLSAHPASSGRTVMFPVPRSPNKFGVLEMVPSSSTDSQYTCLDVTSHLPRYFDGRCRFTAASAVARMVVFAPSANSKHLIVHEYMWDNESKAQSAWHRWEFAHDVAYAYFYGSELIVCFTSGTTLVSCTINPRATSYEDGFLDLSWPATFGDIGFGDKVGQVTPALYSVLGAAQLRAVVPGDIATEVQITRTGALFEVMEEIEGSLRVGVAFESYVVPTRVVHRDYKDRPILTGKLSLLNVTSHTANSGPYKVTLDYGDAEDETQEQGTLLWESPSLELGQPPVASVASNVVPVRSDARMTSVRIGTSELYELNLKQLDHVTSSMNKTKRG